MNARTIDITVKKLTTFIKSYRLAHPELQDGDELVNAAIGSRWPAMEPEVVTYAAFINQAESDLDDMVREAASNKELWIDTNLQGDLFNQVPVRCPEMMLVDGKRTPYYEVSINEAYEFFNTRAIGATAERDAFQQLVDQKNLEITSYKKEIAILRDMIALAKRNGINPATVKYAKKD